MYDENELTYGEHILVRREAKIKLYTSEIEPYIRNITLDKQDIKNDLLTYHFFKSKKVNEKTTLTLEDITDRVKHELKKLTL